MCSGSEAGSYLRLIDFVYHSTLGLRALGGAARFGVLKDSGLGSTVGGVPREQKMLKGHLPRVIYHKVY